MSTFRTSDALLTVVFIFSSSVCFGEAKRSETHMASLSLNEFTNQVLNVSLRSQNVEGDLRSAKWGWTATRRNLTWPQMEASAARSKALSDDDLGSQTETYVSEGSLDIVQPFLTGTRLSLGGTWTETDSNFDTLGYSTSSTTQIFPVWTASISQPLYIFIRNQSLRTRKEAHLSWENSQDNYRSQRLAIEFEARQLYYNAIVQSQTIEIERKKLESASLVNDVTKALVQAGKLAEVELVRASIRAKKDQRNMKNSEIQYEQLINQLKDLILLPRDTDIQLVTPLSYRPFKLSLDELIQTALAKNPSLRIAERQIKLSEFSLQRTQESNRPSFNATGSYSLTQDRTDDTLSLDPYTWNVKLGMDWAFFDATQTRLKTQQEQVSLENNKRSFELQERDLIVSVKNAYLDIKRIEEQISEFEAQRKSAQSNVNAMRLQYRNGLTRLTDVFDAENQLRELELEYLGLLRDFNSAQDRIKTLIGSDLQDSQG